LSGETDQGVQRGDDANEVFQQTLDGPGRATKACAVAILAISMVLESLSLRTAVRESRPYKGDLSWWRFIRSSRQPELPVVLLEDTGALCGLFFALSGVVLASVTGEPRWDAVGSSPSASCSSRSPSSSGGDEGAADRRVGDAGRRRGIRTAMTTAPAVRRLIHLRTEHLGPDELLGGKLIRPHPRCRRWPRPSTTWRRVRAVVPAAHIMYIEPDVHHATSDVT
jgi:hypothetical protein